ncbi:MAG: hypothetical protein Q9M91_08260 [Candidatus Dojkabacteria bacterium]|nr:hypothetical protein [Candidatus Dojkabacteria bacterium]MDQ7021770.1 hypothetical protein [Candidatus Dojkabacteria bacterium]
MAKKNKKVLTYRFMLKETGEHYTIKLSREAYDKLNDKKIRKFSKKLKKHADFELVKLKK